MRKKTKITLIKVFSIIFAVIGVALVALWVIKIDDVVSATGVIEPPKKIYIDSPFSRIIARVLREERDQVKRGDPLVQLENHDLAGQIVMLENEIAHAKAGLDIAKAKLERLKEGPLTEEIRVAEASLQQAKIKVETEEQKLKRANALSERSLVSPQELESAKMSFSLSKAEYKAAEENLKMAQRGARESQLREAEAEIRQAEAYYKKVKDQLEVTQDELKRTTVRSPVDGTVVRVDLHPGMLADEGMILMILAAGTEGPILRAWARESGVWKVRLRDRVEILSNTVSDRKKYMCIGTVVKVHPYGQEAGGERYFEVIVKVMDSPIPLQYGSTADARIIVGRRSILKILLGIEEEAALAKGREEPANELKLSEKGDPKKTAEQPQAAEPLEGPESRRP